MSVKHRNTVNVRSAKRRKLSHDSSQNDDVNMQHEDALSEESEAISDHKEDAESDSENDSPDDDNDDDDARIVGSANAKQKRSTAFRSQLKTSAVPNSSTNTAASLMFQAQTLVADMRPNYDEHLKKARPVIDRIVEVIKAVPEQQPMSLAEAQSFSQKQLRATIPWNPRPHSDVKYNFSFLRPSRITTEGSLIGKLGTRDSLTATITPEMPSELFQEKDYLNYRALHKRAFYLACLASTLSKEMQKDFVMEFCFRDENELVPVLRLSAKANSNPVSSEIFYVSPIFPDSLGPVARMTPAHSCVRKDELAQNQKEKGSDATPVYNNTLRHLSTSTNLSKLVYTAARKVDHFADACLLGDIWLRQRGLSTSRSNGGFGLEEWAIMCALLLEGGGHQGRALFSPRYSMIQLFKAMLQVLGSRDMRRPLVVRGHNQFDTSSVPILYDAETGVNVLYKMTPWSYSRLKHQAASSLTLLNSKKGNTFDSTFIIRVSDTVMQYDESYEIDLTGMPDNSLSKVVQFHDVLEKGLNDRASLIDIRHGSSPTWKLTSSAVSVARQKIVIGLLINPETANRLIDHGPSVEEKHESEQFRKFWGEKSELRRFKDGRINETLVWSAGVPVAQQIITYLCGRHFKLSSSAICASPALATSQLPSKLSADEALAAVHTRFQSFSSTLHHLDGLPLPIRSVSASSESLRSASLILPLEPSTVQPIDTIVQFDSSGRWPDDLRAIQYTKIAFLTKVGDLLRAQDQSLEVRLGLENTDRSTLGTHNTSFLDVIQQPPSPAIPPIIFRIRIHHERELHLIQQALAAKTTLSPADRDVYQSALLIQKQSIASIVHTNAIRALITIFPPLSDTIRLLKRFTACHHLALHIPAEVAEIVAANVFLNPAPWTAPGTATTAFARCLHFLARWDWTIQPLIIDLGPSQDMDVEQRKEIETRFNAWRTMDPNMNVVAYFVGTNIDGTGVAWTQGAAGLDPRPPRVVAGRLTALASAAIELMKAKSQSDSPIMTVGDWEGIFSSSLEDFDFVLHLKEPKKAKAGSGQFKNLELASALNIDTTGIDDATEYVKDLTQAFGSAAIFFYGGKGSKGHVICGLWRPHVRGEGFKPWKIRLGYSTVPVPSDSGSDGKKNEVMCKVNVEGMLAEMAMMGEGIVERISVKE